MDAVPPVHPIDQVLKAYGLGKLEDRLADAVGEHLAECAECCKRVAEISADGFLRCVRDVQTPPKKSNPHQQQTTGPYLDHKAANTSTSSSGDSIRRDLDAHPDYLVKRELGRGGMGVVYLAHNTLLKRDEVLKVMGQHLVKRSGVLERFLREMQLVARLRHPNIVTAYHATRLGQSIVFSMEYVDGLDLSKLVKAKGPLPLAHACLFIHQAALGLQHAHEEGLVHRDIKPHNLMLSRKGNKATIKILDFGLAKAACEERASRNLTFAGQALGTPDFIAPEQILDAATADIRADIYSLGATFYFLLTGRAPFQATSLYDLYQAHISREADPLNLVRPEVPSELSALIAKMLAKDPKRRFQTPEEVARALTPFFRKGGVVVTRPAVQPSTAGPATATETVNPADSITSHAIPDTSAAPVGTTHSASPSLLDSHWEGLIDYREPSGATEREPAIAAARRSGWVWLSTVVGVLLMGVFAAWFSGWFEGKTPHGGIALDHLPGDSEVSVDRASPTLSGIGDGKPIKIRSDSGQQPIEVKKVGFKAAGEVETVATTASEKVAESLERRVPERAAPRDHPSDPSLRNAICDEGTDWSIQDGALRQTGAANYRCILFGDPDWRDYDFTFDVTRVGGAERGFCAVYRGQDLNNFMSFRYGIYRDGNWTEVCHFDRGQSKRDVQTLTGIKFSQTHTYSIRISIRGSHIVCLVDGVTVFDYIDEFITNGRVGFQSSGTELVFANIKVSSPTGTLLWEGLPVLPSPSSGGAGISVAAPVEVPRQMETPPTPAQVVRPEPVSVQTSAKPVRYTMSTPLTNGGSIVWHTESTSWSVADGMLRFDLGPENNHSIYSQQMYKNFVFRCRLLMPDGGNTGVLFRGVQGIRGPECEIAGSLTGRLFHGGYVAGLSREMIETIHRKNDFDELMIRCFNKHVTIMLNGVITVQGEFPSIADAGMIGFDANLGGMIRIKDFSLVELKSE